MARIFGLRAFWSGFLDDELQSLAADVAGCIKFDKKPPTEAIVRNEVVKRAKQERNRIGRDPLAIAKSFFYEHVAQTALLLGQIVRTCEQGT